MYPMIGRLGLPRLLTQRSAIIRCQSTAPATATPEPPLPQQTTPVEQNYIRSNYNNRRWNNQSRGRSFKALSQYYPDPSKPGAARPRTIPALERTRLVPTNATAYTRNPDHEQHLSNLIDLLNKYLALPFNKKHATSQWASFGEYKQMGGFNKLRITEYEKIITVLKRLDSIDPQLRNDEITSTLKQYQTQNVQHKIAKKEPKLDDFGRAKAVGRRKSSSAKVYVVEGSGEFLVNNKPMEKVFPKLEDRQRLLFPLHVVESENSYNVFAMVRGGGSTGQVDSVKLAIARALCIHNPLFKRRLFEAGCLTRDHRAVERKKPGHLKARKMPTWVKR
ncbi:unnamed protein product [Ambrosiozyma monospora]|uniref:Unnamed protein product n=1 Tax=Ambrosiozyma monospora TaxID=43982 RepID=A0ACB5T789_AMBMO|nr:unnamed protein product [Ambrosiozyma monospora]